MEAIGRSWRIRVALGVLAALAGGLGVWSLRPMPAPAPVAVSLGPSQPQLAFADPIVELDRLYALDHLVLDGDPALDLRATAPVGAGPPVPSGLSVPEPARLWILGFAALYTLYLPARSW